MERFLADAVVLLHLGFVLFAIGGGLLLTRWPRIAWLHLPALAWGVLLEFNGWICPLTPLENALRLRAGQAGYAGGFVEHYLLPLLYPAGLTVSLQWGLGTALLLFNALVYGAWWWRRRRR